MSNLVNDDAISNLLSQDLLGKYYKIESLKSVSLL